MLDSILYWNDVCDAVTKEDYSTPDPTINPNPQQVGPTHTSRALAMIHLAMHDAYFGVTKTSNTYLPFTAGDLPVTNSVTAARAAVGAAACLMLISLYSRQKADIQTRHEAFITQLNGNDPAVARGLAWGRTVANAMLADRKNDGSELPNDFYAPSTEPGRHRADPLNPAQGFLSPEWGKVKPFTINNLTTQIPGSNPPPMNDNAYTTAFLEVYAVGRKESATRTIDQTAVGLFWAYDGARNIGVPPRLYNQVVRAILAKKGTSESENARILAMVNAAMADAGIQAWDQKYRHNIWRPVIGVRESDAQWGPAGQGDGNPLTAGDPDWVPLGAPATNQPQRADGTPPFPAYPSGHASFGTAALMVVQNALNLDSSFTFSFVSDELNGESVGKLGVRTRHVRQLTIDKAIDENVRSRVYLGVHWLFDGLEGKKNGEKIAQMVVANFPARA